MVFITDDIFILNNRQVIEQPHQDVTKLFDTHFVNYVASLIISVLDVISTNTFLGILVFIGF